MPYSKRVKFPPKDPCVTRGCAPLRRDPSRGDVPTVSPMAGRDPTSHGDAPMEGLWGDCDEDPEAGGTLRPPPARPHPSPTVQTCPLRDPQEGPLAQTQTLRDFEKVTAAGAGGCSWDASVGPRRGWDCRCRPRGAPRSPSPPSWLTCGGHPGLGFHHLSVPTNSTGRGKNRKGALARAPVPELRAGREPWARCRHVRGAGMPPPWSTSHG